MTVHLTLAQNPNNIEESQYGTGPQVQFSPITSCILIAGITGDDNVAGIHLVMVQPDGEPFGVGDVDVVTTRLGELGVSPSSVIVFGQAQMWADNVPDAYQALLGALGLVPAQATDLDDGTYGASIGAGGQLQIFQAAGLGRRGGRHHSRVRPRKRLA
ncbi:MAG TPA: hypothetical protein VFQ67_10870 [Allosphingosinicella sp.]|nr:hypothetical protein [Allosphingosinicella sp.]